jgi:alkanesulfonate monooxygenase SsuD/methylene tetrahydromethanopterin reductase-like flavin-dependent oxidoreductase (luciferase family)
VPSGDPNPAAALGHVPQPLPPMSDIGIAFAALRDAPPRDVVGWARGAEARGFTAVFLTESFNDSLGYAGAVALATTRIAVGTAITNVYLRHPTLLAEAAAAVQELSHGRFRLGVGVGHREVNVPLGIRMDDPVGTMREVVTTLRSAWVKGPHQPRPAVPPAIYMAGLRARMLELAGAVADGVILNLVPLSRYPAATAALARGAAAAGRDLANFTICHFTTCYLSSDLAAARRQARRMLARYANLPFYGRMLAESGFEAEIAAIGAAWARREVEAAEAAVSDALVDATTLVGPPERCRERLDAFRRAGAALPIVFANPVGETRAEAVARAIRAFAP